MTAQPASIEGPSNTARRSLRCLLILLAIPFFSAPLRADDWPQWRGSNRDGIWRETGIVEKIPAAGLPFRWRAKVGNGYSGPVVAGGRVFVNDHIFDPERERLLCFDEATGKPLWEYSYPTNYKDMEYGNGPRASPTVHEGRVYSLGTQGHLICADAAGGKLIWKKSLTDDLQGRVPRYGVSAAPLVVDDLLIICAGGETDTSVVALDRKTGELRWKALADRPAYSAPILTEAGGARQLIVWTADNINSLDPLSGKVHWQIPWKATFDPAQMVANPVRHREHLLLMGAWNRGSKMLTLDAAKPAATILWETPVKPTTTLTTPLFQDDGCFYAILGNGILACLDENTGKEVWSTREPTSGSFSNGHLVANGDRTFLFNSTGHLILCRLTVKGYQELGRCLLVEPTAGYRAQGPITWAHPAFANKCVFARNDRELVCASLAAGKELATVTAPPPQEIKARVLTYFDQNPALGLAYSDGGKTLAAATSQGLVKVLDLTNNDQDLPAPKPHNDWVCAVTFSRDGRFLVSAGGSEFANARNGNKTTGQIKVWDVGAGKETGELKGHENKVFSAAFAPAGEMVATAGADKTVRLWNAATLEQRLVLSGHTDAVWSVAWSPDGETIASAGADGTVKLWNAATGAELATLRGHDGEVRSVAFCPDGKTLASGGADWTVRLWDLASRKERAILKKHQGAVQSLAFTSGGGTLASGSSDETVILWDPASGNERAVLRGQRSGVTAVTFSPDNKTLASAGLDDAVRLWEVSTITEKFAWQTATPESQGLSPERLETVRARMESKKTRAFLVARNDRIVCEWYAPGVSADAKQGTASLAKALVGGMPLAVAMEDGKIALDDPAAKFIPQWKDDSKKSKITIRQLGSHTSGLSDSTTEGVKHEEQPGWMGEFWQRLDPPHDPFTLARDATPLIFEPGTELQYSNPGIGLLTYCVTAATGQDARTLLRERILRPIGVTDAEWSAGYGKTFMVDGLPLAGSWGGAAFTPRATARIGRLVLRGGDWDGRPLLRKEVVRQVTGDSGLPGNCGMGWWTNAGGRYPKLPKDAVWGAGAGDQLLLVVPSLNLVMVRNGETLTPGPGEPPVPQDDVFTKYHDYRARILFEPLAEAVTDQKKTAAAPAVPYPPSARIRELQWAPKDTIVRKARGSDNWPLAWADDGALYGAYGDGNGFEPFEPQKLSLGLARIEGLPDNFRGVNLSAPTLNSTGDGAAGRKASGLLCVKGVLYVWMRNADNSQLAWSRDHGATWTVADWKFTESFGCPAFVEFGQDYAGARDAFVYVYSPDTNSAYTPADHMVLARVPQEKIGDRDAYEFFAGHDDTVGPKWSRDLAQRRPVFTHGGRCYRPRISYHAALRCYLLVHPIPSSSSAGKPDTRFAGGLAVFDAPEPWGPWTTAFFTESWDTGPGDSAGFIPKWTGADGKTLHLVFSGDDCFSVRRAAVVPAW